MNLQIGKSLDDIQDMFNRMDFSSRPDTAPMELETPMIQSDDADTEYNYTPVLASLVEYMINSEMNVEPLPSIIIRNDEEEGKSFFGKTAYYDPSQREIVLYVYGRHPKDVVRSFSHEMIHHIQNLENRLGGIETSNTNEDWNLLNLEKEAYLDGNITFRMWEDTVKNKF